MNTAICSKMDEPWKQIQSETASSKGSRVTLFYLCEMYRVSKSMKTGGKLIARCYWFEGWETKESYPLVSLKPNKDDGEDPRGDTAHRFLTS